MYRYRYQGRCDVHGLVYTQGYSLTPPPLCPIDQGNIYSNPIAYCRRLEPLHEISHKNTIIGSYSIYTLVDNIIWGGTDANGCINKIEVLASVSIGDTGYVKIYDETNHKTICEITGITGTEINKYETTSISNLSSSDAIWSIQIKASGLLPTLKVYEILCK